MNPWALDTETFLLFPGYLAPEMVCTSWAHNGDSNLIHGRESGLQAFVGDRIAHEHTVYANAPYDLGVFGAKWPALIPALFEALDDGRIHDVQTNEKLLDLARGTFRFEEDEDGIIHAKGYALADITERRLGKVLEKDLYRMRYHDFWDKPCSAWPQGARDYAIGDATATLAIWEQQQRLKQYTEDAAAQVRAHWALHLMSCWGMKTDSAAVDRLERRVKDEIDEIREGLVDDKLVRPDGTRDTKAAVRRMVEVMGKDAILTTKGQEMQREVALQRAADEGRFVSVSEDAAMMSGDATLLRYSKYTKLRNLLRGSIKDLRRGETVPIQTRFQVLMETGRTSSAGPNLQNLRRAPGVRECFIPRAGKVIVACDYSSAELHTLAQVCLDQFGESKLAEALNNGTDVHLWVGAQILGIPYDEAQLRLKAGDEEMAEARQLAKAANFGFPGGCSAKRFVGIAFSYGVDIDIRDAEKLRALWFASWPEMRLFFDHVSECQDGNGWHYVKQPRVPRLRSRCSWTSACNSNFQELCADGAKAAAYEVAKEQFVPVWMKTESGLICANSPLYGSRSILFIHDEILAECPEANAHEVGMRLSFVMEREFNKFVPDVPVTAIPTVMRRWSKKAKQVRDADGRLIPWEEKAA